MNDTNLSDILEIKPPMEVETGSSILWPVIILAVLFIIGAVLLIWAYRKPNTGGTPPAPDAEAHRRLRQAWVLLGEPVLFAEAVAEEAAPQSDPVAAVRAPAQESLAPRAQPAALPCPGSRGGRGPSACPQGSRRRVPGHVLGGWTRRRGPAATAGQETATAAGAGTEAPS